MFSDPFGLPQDYAAGSDILKNAAIISMNGSQVVRAFTANTAAGDPKFMKINHQISGKGANARDRHVVRFDAYAVIGGVEDKSKLISLYTVAEMPRSEASNAAAITTMQVLSAYMTGFIRGRGPGATGLNPTYSHFTRLINGES